MKVQPRQLVPYGLTVLAAALYGWVMVNGGFGYSKEHRPMPPLAAASLEDGRLLSDESLRGQPLILNVWAPSCAPCRHELPSLDKLAGEYAGRVRFLGLIGWGSPAEAKAIVRSEGLGHLSMLAGGEEFLGQLGVESVPTTFFVRGDGTIVARQVGLRGEGFFREQAEKLLAGQL